MDFGKLNTWLQVSANIGIVLGLVLVGGATIEADDRSVTDYTLAPQRILKTSMPSE